MEQSDRVWRERGLQAAVLGGDERAWQTWYDESFDTLFAYVSWRCGSDRALAEDIVQDMWLTAVRRIRSFEPERGRFIDWLRGIAANVLRNHIRSNHQDRPRLADIGYEPADRHSIESVWEHQHRARRIALALARLSEEYEAVLRAKYLEELSVAEIAEAWQKSPKAIESLLTRARQAFREAYQQLEETWID